MKQTKKVTEYKRLNIMNANNFFYAKGKIGILLYLLCVKFKTKTQ